jgi:6-phosphofructokinase 1
MAGFTAFSTGLVNNRLVYLPITAITANSPRRMNPRGRTYERLLQTTRQPDPYQSAAFYGLDKKQVVGEGKGKGGE